MATHGSIGEFNSSKGGWVFYTERLEQYFAANEVVSADKQMGNITHLLRTRYLPTDEKSVSTSKANR